MGGIYITDMLDVLRSAGCQVRENSDTNGWQKRARSSGGFADQPLGIQWHHTASKTAPENDVHYQVHGKDNPIGNCLLDRNGCYWPIAAGAANTAGKGGPLTLSRGIVAANCANSQTFAIEAANNGVGDPWPQIQIDSWFAGSNALNARFGNRPDDIFTHALGSGDGWTDRKIDPATASAVQGPWKPRSTNSSGTWMQADIRAECNRRAGSTPEPIAPDNGNEIDMAYACEGIWVLGDANGTPYGMTVAVYSGGYKTWIPNDKTLAAKQNLCALNGVDGTTRVQQDCEMWNAFGPLVGPVPNGYDAFGVPI